MSENDVIILAGYTNFATTHKFYLAVADDLVTRVREASVKKVSDRIWHTFVAQHLFYLKTKKTDKRKYLSATNLT